MTVFVLLAVHQLFSSGYERYTGCWYYDYCDVCRMEVRTRWTRDERAVSIMRGVVSGREDVVGESVAVYQWCMTVSARSMAVESWLAV